ncbi:MAG: ATP-binding protein, partial [Candidatus Fermentibacteria bacterium]
MIIERYDIRKGGLTIFCGRDEVMEIPGCIAGLIIVAEECCISELVVKYPGRVPARISRTIQTLVERNPWIRIEETSEFDEGEEISDLFPVSRMENFLLLRDARSDRLYSMVVSAERENVELASRTACLLANLMGFSGSTAFDVRFGVYEILMNAVEHYTDPDGKRWIQVQIEKKDRKLSVSIADKGGEFDPTGEREFDLEDYISGGKRRGLGLILMKRMYESFRYERKNGLNRIFFNRTLPSTGNGEKADEMPSMEAGEFVDLGNGLTGIELRGDLDAKGALALETLMEDLVDKKILKVVLDFENVHFVSSAGVGMLLGLLMAFLAVYLGLSQHVSGLGITLF